MVRMFGQICLIQNNSPPNVPYSMNTTNPYITQILSQGKEPVNKPAELGEFPKTIYGRTFDTKEEYLEALHDFLNGN